MVLAVLKLTIEVHWSWWRVLLPLWVVLGHNVLYIAVGFVWLFFVDDGGAGERVTIRQDDHSYGYQLAAMLCFLIFADSLLGRIEGHEETVWFGLSSGRWELIFVPGEDRCVQILRECGFLPTGPVGVVNLGDIPEGLNAEELERFLRKNGAETRGLRSAQDHGGREGGAPQENQAR